MSNLRGIITDNGKMAFHSTIVQHTNLINIWSLGMRTWSNLRTPLSILLYAPLPNFPPISPRVTPGRGEWSSKLRSCTMKPATRIHISCEGRDGLTITLGNSSTVHCTVNAVVLSSSYQSSIYNCVSGSFPQATGPPLNDRNKL
jgi:hypothetical protein